VDAVTGDGGADNTEWGSYGHSLAEMREQGSRPGACWADPRAGVGRHCLAVRTPYNKNDRFKNYSFIFFFYEFRYTLCLYT
jgi:hypothetical protein